MHPVRKQRLMIVALIAVFSSIAIGLLVYALRENLNMFYPPAEVAAGKAPLDKNFRVGGYVVEGSVERKSSGLQVGFDLTDGSAQVHVVYEGILPDLFSEGEAAIAEGKLDASGVFHADTVLAKHDENYTPPEVSETAIRPDGKYEATQPPMQ